MKNLIRSVRFVLTLIASLVTALGATDLTNKVTVSLESYGVVFKTPGWGKYYEVHYVCDFSSKLTQVVGKYICFGDGCSDVFNPSDDSKSKEAKEWASFEKKFRALGVGFQNNQGRLEYASSKDPELALRTFTLVSASYDGYPSDWSIVLKDSAQKFKVVPWDKWAAVPPAEKPFSIYLLGGKYLPVVETLSESTNRFQGTMVTGTVELFSGRPLR